MALEYGYFDSEITGYDDEGMPIFDRAQTSDFMADFFSKLISSGVLASPSTCFQVTAHDGLTVAIAPGYGFIRGRFAYDESTAYLTLEDAPTTGTYSRIDMVVLRANYADRLCELVVKTGTAGTSPAEPELLQPTSGGDYYELCLAKITVNANASVISQSNITDTRYNSAYCGAVVQLIDGIDTSVLLAQFEATLEEFVDKSDASYKGYVESMEAYLSSLKESGDGQLESIVNVFNAYEKEQEAAFDEWFQTMKDQLSEDAAGNLQLQIDNAVEADDDIIY